MTMTTDVRPPKKPGRAPSVHGPNGKAPFDLNNLLYALQAMKVGDFSVRMTGDQLGIEGKIADAFNEIVAANERMAKQLEKVGQVVGREGKTRQRVRLGVSGGGWGEVGAAGKNLHEDLLLATPEGYPRIWARAPGG